MTDEKIRETVARMRMTDDLKAILLKQAIVDRDASARFVVYAAWLRSAR